MPAPKSKPSSGGPGDAKSQASSAKTSARKRITRTGAATAKNSGARGHAEVSTPAPEPSEAVSARHEIADQIFRPLDLVMLTRDRIQDTLDDFAARGRVTRHDANELVAELVRLGREQTEDILTEFEHLLDRGRDQFETATRKARRTEPVDRIVRTADRARRTVGVGPAFPILGYDDLTAGQVVERLVGLTPPQLRKVRDYERRHANRKTVLEAIEKAL